MLKHTLRLQHFPSHQFMVVSPPFICNIGAFTCTTTTTTKPFVPSIWGKLHEPKENYVRSVTWISFLHSFLSSNMLPLRPLASISCRITSIHVFFGLSCSLLTCPNLICSTRQTGTFTCKIPKKLPN